MAQGFLSIGSWQALYAAFRSVFIFLDIALLGISLFAIWKILKLRPPKNPGRKAKKKTLTLQTAVFIDRWNAVQRKIFIGSPESLRLGVIEADEVVDSVLKALGLAGEHMADRLAKVNPDTLQSLNRVWRAHRLRNDLAHTPGFSLSLEDAQAAIGDYESFLKEIGILK